MVSTTFRTLPATHRKLKTFQCVAAMGTPFTGWIPFVDLDKGTPILGCFVLQLPDDFTPARITDSLCEFRVFDHVLDLQTFHADKLVFLNQFCGQFVLEVLATVSNFGVNSGNLQFCLSEISGAFLLPAKTTLVLCQLRFVLVGVFGISRLCAIGSNNAVFDPKNDTDGATGDRQGIKFCLTKHRDKVPTCTVFGDSHSGWFVGNILAPTDIQWFFVLGEREFSIVPLESRAGVLSALSGSFFLESWIFRPTIPEVFET